MLVAADITRDQLAQVESERFALPGVTVAAEARRNYPEGTTLSQRVDHMLARLELPRGDADDGAIRLGGRRSGEGYGRRSGPRPDEGRAGSGQEQHGTQ